MIVAQNPPAESANQRPMSIQKQGKRAGVAMGDETGQQFAVGDFARPLRQIAAVSIHRFDRWLRHKTFPMRRLTRPADTARRKWNADSEFCFLWFRHAILFRGKHYGYNIHMTSDISFDHPARLER